MLQPRQSRVSPWPASFQALPTAADQQAARWGGAATHNSSFTAPQQQQPELGSCGAPTPTLHVLPHPSHHSFRFSAPQQVPQWLQRTSAEATARAALTLAARLPFPAVLSALCLSLFLETLYFPASQTTGQNIRKLIKDGLVIQKPTVIHSRDRARVQAEAKAKGRHSGYGETQC